MMKEMPMMKNLTTGGGIFNDSVIEAIKAMNKKPEKTKTAEEIRAEEMDAEREALIKRIVEKEGFDEEKDLMWAVMYRDLVPGDVNGPISIKLMKEFFENVMVKDRPNMRDKVLNYYQLEEGDLPKKKLFKLADSIETFLSGFRTIENIYEVSLAFREAAEQMAPKLKVDETMSLIEKIKWLRVWAVVVRDQMLFWGDMDKNRRFIGKENTIKFNSFYIYPETMTLLYKLYFYAMPDETVILDMLQRLLKLYPEEVQKKILKYGEFDENVPDSMKVERIRNDVKKELFPIPWVTESAYFCTTAGIGLLEPERIKKAVEAYMNGGIESLPAFESSYIDVYNTCKRKKMKCYRYDSSYTRDTDFRGSVTCNQELEMYVETYKWLLEHPDFRFGEEGKTIAEYGMEKLLERKATFEETAEAWALESGYAKDEKDVNVELLSLAMDEDGRNILLEYYEGEISSDTTAKKLGLKSESQARLLCSKTAKFSVNAEREMKDSLKRIKQFGTSMCSKSDNIYLQIFKYMLENRKSDLPKGIVNLYGKMF